MNAMNGILYCGFMQKRPNMKGVKFEKLCSASTSINGKSTLTI